MSTRAISGDVDSDMSLSTQGVAGSNIVGGAALRTKLYICTQSTTQTEIMCLFWFCIQTL